jgi:hypothetical protein
MKKMHVTLRKHLFTFVQCQALKTFHVSGVFLCKDVMLCEGFRSLTVMRQMVIGITQGIP